MLGLPPHTAINRVVPKNSFYEGLKTSQKKDFVDLVERIRWQHKLSSSTINLPTAEWEEIQVFSIELKERAKIDSVLDIIDKAIPYLIIFKVVFEKEFYLSAAIKHRHPTDDARAVIDARFSTDWTSGDPAKEYNLELKRDLNYVFKRFCQELEGVQIDRENALSGEALAAFHNRKTRLEREIARLEQKVKSCKQFNKRVDLNLKKKAKEEELRRLIDNPGQVIGW